MTALGIPLDAKRYRPDTDEPVDRWFQAANASNARTTAEVLRLVGGEVVLDPFCGGGSTAAAARIRGLSFYGIEHDPLLACVSLAKAEGRSGHLPLLPDPRGAADDGWLAGALDGLQTRIDPEDIPVVSALAVVIALRAARQQSFDLATLGADLDASQTEAKPGHIVCGDATGHAAWDMLEMPGTDAVVYTSPPFGVSSPTLSAPAAIRDAAATVIDAAGLLARPIALDTPPSYADVTMGMLHQMVMRVDRGRLVLEHEPDDDGLDSTTIVMQRIGAELGDILHSPTVDRYDSFSRRGPFTLISYRIR
jgi:hypothetical protein